MKPSPRSDPRKQLAKQGGKRRSAAKPATKATTKSATRASKTAAAAPVPALKRLRAELELSRPQFARLLGFSERAVAGWEAGRPPSEAAERLAMQIERVRVAFARVARRESVGAWLLAPNEALDGHKPLELIERGQTDRLWRLLFALESGLPG